LNHEQTNLRTLGRMTVDYFPITQVRNGWLLSWPNSDIRRIENKQRLANLIFDSLGLEEIRFGVQLNSGETEYLHIHFNDWIVSHRGSRLDDMLDQYVITGVLFDSESSAQWLQDYLEKRLMWRHLTQKAA